MMIMMMMLMMIPPLHDVSLQTVNYSAALLFLLLANISGFLFLCLNYMLKKIFFCFNWSAEEKH